MEISLASVGVAAILALVYAAGAWLDERAGEFGAGVVAKAVGVTVLLPLAAGLTVHRVAPMMAERIAPWAARVGNVLLLASLLAVLIATGPAIVSLVGNGTVLVIAAVVATGLMAGHWLGGPDPDDRTALAIASSMRHPGIALAIARLNFPEEPLVPAAVLLFLLVNVFVTLPYGAWRRSVHVERDARPRWCSRSSRWRSCSSASARATCRMTSDPGA